MPSEKILEQKKQMVSDLSEKLKKAVCGVLVDYKGISVDQDTRLRSELRKENIDYFVIKNRILKLAFKNVGLSDLEYVLKGTTSIAISYEDPIAPAKLINKYSKELTQIFNIKAGFIDNKAVDVKSIENLAELPSKETLISMTLAGLNAPIVSFINVLNANIRGLAIVLNAIAQKKGA